MIHIAKVIIRLARLATRNSSHFNDLARMPHTASAKRLFHTAECHTAARAEPQLPVPDVESVLMMAESLGQTEK